MEHIASRDNERVKTAVRVANSASFRKESGLLFAEGARLCRDLAETLPLRQFFCARDLAAANEPLLARAAESFLISDPVAAKLASTKTPQGVFGLFEQPPCLPERLDTARGLLLGDNVSDPGNMGAMLRSAAAFGYGGAVLGPGCADPFSPKALRASMGAVGRVPLYFPSDLAAFVEKLKTDGVLVLAASDQNAQPPGKITPAGPVAVLVGNEGAGVSDTLVNAASGRVFIPMQNGVESLNAAVAASVLLYAFSQDQ